MKRILITGEKSYIGVIFNKWVSRWPDKYNVEFLSLRNEEWKNKDFSNFDVLIHVAAIVHKKERPGMQNLYTKVNRDLTKELAYKAKTSGIKQFIFMSSMSIYGIEGRIGEEVIINKDTLYNPNTFYGISKLEAEFEINKLSDEIFRIAIIRAPMIYGPNCPGNYIRLKKLIITTPVFPLVKNQRSMIFIYNLTEFIRLLIENQDKGTFFPQNENYVDTSDLVKLISKENSHNIFLSKVLAFGIILFGGKFKIFDKVFGNLKIDLSLSNYKNFDYCIADLEKSIKVTENPIDNNYMRV